MREIKVKQIIFAIFYMIKYNKICKIGYIFKIENRIKMRIIKN